MSPKVGVEGKKYTMGPKTLSHETLPALSPGPGAYDELTNAILEKEKAYRYFVGCVTSFSFPKDERRDEAKGPLVPGPGKYDVLNKTHMVNRTPPSWKYERELLRS